MLDLEIIFEDINVLVLNKPSGLVVHGDGKTKQLTLSDLLIEKYPSIKNVGEPVTLQDGTVIERFGIVHRLDKETSGVMLIAKTNEMFMYLKRQFQKRRILKEYHAFVYGEFAEKRGSISDSIGTSKSDFRKKTTKAVRGEKRDALTDYVAGEATGGVSFVKFFPKTGRTHQIRVHAQLMGHPIVADSLYAPKMKKLLNFQRLALHSRRISLPFPGGDERSFAAVYPDDFQKAIEEFKEQKIDFVA